MTKYSVQLRDEFFVKLLSLLLKRWVKILVKNTSIIKNVSRKYSKKLLDHAKQSA